MQRNPQKQSAKRDGEAWMSLQFTCSYKLVVPFGFPCDNLHLVLLFLLCRALQRLDSVTKSPVFVHFAETLGGLTSIRAFRY